MENAKHDRECTDCDLATDERLNYFTGQFLAERDFRAEQEYQIGKHRQHNRYLHGYGTVCGLKIVQHPNPECQERFVILEPGLALDCCGREIVVKEKVYIDLVKLFAAQNIDLNNIKPGEQNYLLFSLCYEECKTEFVPALYSECGCDEFGCDANRIVEGFEVHLQLLKNLPKPQHEEPAGVSLDWTQCSEIIWRALDGCPECPEDNCIPLAIVEKYVENYKKQDAAITNARIENRKYRPLVPSTETLKQLVMCALETGGGTKGKEGSQEPQGKEGKPGLELNPDLPKILDIKWTHGFATPWSSFEQMKYDVNPNEISNTDKHFLTVYFDREMANIDRETFKVWIDYPGIQLSSGGTTGSQVFEPLGIYNALNIPSQNGMTFVALPLPLYGRVIPLPSPPYTTPHTNENSPYAVTFVPHKKVFNLILVVLRLVLAARQKLGPEEIELPSVHVLLKGDFIGSTSSFDPQGNLSDENGILDADNIGGQVGRNRNRGGIIGGGKNSSGDLVSGGDFESWFFLKSPTENQLLPDRLREMIATSPFSELGINLADLIQPQ